MTTIHRMTVGGRQPVGRGRSRPRRGVILAAGFAVAIGVSSCSGGGSAAPSTPSATTALTAPIVAAAIAPTKPQRQIPADKQIVEVPALRKTIAMTGCKAASQGWAGTGTAKNTSSAAKTYHILVFFTEQYSRTIDYARTDVKVAAGESAAWSATTTFNPPKGTQCVLRGLSQTPA